MTNLTGIQLKLLMGKTRPTPAKSIIGENLESVEVYHTDQGRSGFQITLVGIRSGTKSKADYKLMTSPQISLFNRVIILVCFKKPKPQVLFDGIITHRQLVPGSGGEHDRIVITGEDVSVMMDQKEVIKEYPSQTEASIVNKILKSYSKYGIKPNIKNPPSKDKPNPKERTPVQNGTDLEYINDMARRYGYVFYIEAGPNTGSNIGYWGPPVSSKTQSALTVNMGNYSNVDSISFAEDPLGPALVSGVIQDRKLNKERSLNTKVSKRKALSKTPSIKSNRAKVRVVLPSGIDGLTYDQASPIVQGLTDASTDQVVTAMGEINSLTYGNILMARRLVGVRGAGKTYDGSYYVKEVRHIISKGGYIQKFKLTREGTGATKGKVVP